MRLKQLRLAGFKSFVDPTTISFPSNRVGVVGPNGCGKSNVIDAVRWVMGESSAKTLRGSAMTDVIFNGSSRRNPADSAEIELVFEDVALPQYPDAEELGIKRRLSRDGQSQYFINGVRCRRKDIADILLGTGLGPRSYTIIEQGMISRFIEAKPEELRNFIEEAAGISRYKERRRETELRIEHTRENMNRLNDVREEMHKQLDRLKRQARAAEKYQQLKEAEHLLKAQLLAMRWRNYHVEVEKQQDLLSGLEPALEEHGAHLVGLEEEHGREREAQQAAQARFNAAQEAFYAHQSELDRLAQSIEHNKEKQEQLAWDLEQTQQSQEEARRTLDSDGEQLTHLQDAIGEAEAELEDAQMEAEALETAVQDAEQAWQAWQAAWEDFNQRVAEPTQQIQVERQRIQALEQSLARHRERQARLEAEKRELDLTGLESELGELQAQLLEAEETLAERQEALAAHQEAILVQREANQAATQAVHAQQAQLQNLTGRLASLEALQEAALGKHNTDLVHWLEARGFHDKVPRLAQVLKVEPGWERAVETVLGAHLEALCIDDLQNLATQLDSLPQGKLSVLDSHLDAHEHAGRCQAPRLLDKVEAEWPVRGLLAGIYTADSFADAYALRDCLGAHESVITAQGLWLGPNWLVISEEMDQRAGVFAREQDIQRLRQDLVIGEAKLAELDARQEMGRTELHRREDQREQAAAHIHAAQRQLAELRAQQGGGQARLEQMSLRAQRVLSESAEVHELLARDQDSLAEAQERLIHTEDALAGLQEQRDALLGQREAKRVLVEQTRQRWQQAQDRRHQVAGRLQAMRADVARLQQGIARLRSTLEQLEDRRYDLQKALEAQQSLDEWEQRFGEQQSRQQELQAALEQARGAVQQSEATVRALEQARREAETRGAEQRKLLEETRLNHQSNLVRRQSVEELLAETPFQVEQLLAELPAEANEAAWVEGIDDVEKRILKLGSINLAALEEFGEQEQRKKYLDDQYADLENAMNLLEQAIQAIDDETRSRFQQTLDKVNDGFQRLFPHVFGGGEASLRLTGEDVLSAGVVVMARPPGKRNTTIHLLSGGEKALTAVALVFAIFELNPAPFCMLDEVDAPLDDTNVGRYCKLVTKMSEHVQFIFITHNKIAMEMADQLIGVTMQEPGVSRPVAVDVDLAVEMVAV